MVTNCRTRYSWQAGSVYEMEEDGKQEQKKMVPTR